MLNRMTMLLAQAAGDGEPKPSGEDQTNNAIDQAKTNLELALQGDLGALWELFSPLIGALVILVIAFIAGKMLAGLVQRSSEKAKIDITLSRFFGKLIYYIVLLVGVMFALGKFGFEVTSFAAILAAAGFAVGMALSGTLGNFASGAMLLIFRPFKVGDMVQVSGITAKVYAIELFTTTLDTFDNRRIIIPNSKVYDDVIENISYHPERRMDVNVGASYDADIDKTREALTRAADSLMQEYGIEREGRGYQVYLLGLGGSSVDWVIRFWSPSDICWTLKEKLVQAIKRELDAADIGIPYPQMDVHLDKPGD